MARVPAELKTRRIFASFLEKQSKYNTQQKTIGDSVDVHGTVINELC